VRAELVPEVERVLDLVVQALVAAGDLRARLAAERRPALAPAVREMSSHVDALVHPGFATEHGRDRLPDVLRYLQAVGVRLDRLPENPARDARAAADVARAEADLADLRKRVPPSPEVEAVRWMVEELRVSLFAQGVRTKHPVSLQRIWKAMDALLP
jgi:ATP-dependent helicase HrpA